ncbi:MAG: hypothetical protein EOO99_11965 [Pedobacter sp.]|nr:MAG: hypothetical protein EOO99_11965 [Pedobacter sp.]
MKHLIIGLISILFISCNLQENKELTISYYNLREVGAFRFTGSDTIYQEVTFPNAKSHYYQILDKKQKTILNNFLSETRFEKLDSIYTSKKKVNDPAGLYFKIQTNEISKNIFIDANTPNEFVQIIDLLKSLIKTENRTKISYHNFGDYRFVPPAPPIIDSNSR